MKKWVCSVAIKAAKRSLFEPNKHAAVLESGGSILAIACNSPKASNPQTSCSIHAEVAAIKKLGIRAKPRCDLYVARINKGKFQMLSVLSSEQRVRPTAGLQPILQLERQLKLLLLSLVQVPSRLKQRQLRSQQGERKRFFHCQ